MGTETSGRMIFVGVTGAQGVGKSTFCRKLAAELPNRSNCQVALSAGLGDHLRTMGISLGSASDKDTIAAVFAAHLDRERVASGGIVILDRCVADALTYTRCLDLNSVMERHLYESIATMSAARLALIVHLSLSPFFAVTHATHETTDLRQRIAEGLPSVLRDLGRPTLDLNAAAPDAIECAIAAILDADCGPW